MLARASRRRRRSKSGARSSSPTATMVDRSTGSFSMFHMSASASLMCSAKRGWPATSLKLLPRNVDDRALHDLQGAPGEQVAARTLEVDAVVGADLDELALRVRQVLRVVAVGILEEREAVDVDGSAALRRLLLD